MITTTVNINKQLDKEYSHLFDIADKLINSIINIINNPPAVVNGAFSNEDDDNIQYYEIDTETSCVLKTPFKIQLDDVIRLDNKTDNTQYEITQETVNSITELLNNRNQYEGLFDGTEGTENPNIQINSLAEYFGVLDVLYKIHPRFIRLPLNEGYYIIDANTRTITPGSSTPTFAVRGDHVAETIYF